MAVEARCQTPGAVFHTHVQPTKVQVTVDLPQRLDLAPSAAARLEANIHNALEPVLAAAMTDARTMTLDQFEMHLLSAENATARALDLLYGEGKWDQAEADALCNAILGAIAQAREDATAGVYVPPRDGLGPITITAVADVGRQSPVQTTGLLERLDESLLDGPGGEAEAPLIYAAIEIERLSPNDPVPSCLRALADVLIEERAR